MFTIVILLPYWDIYNLINNEIYFKNKLFYALIITLHHTLLCLWIPSFLNRSVNDMKAMNRFGEKYSSPPPSSSRSSFDFVTTTFFRPPLILQSLIFRQHHYVNRLICVLNLEIKIPFFVLEVIWKPWFPWTNCLVWLLSDCF